MTDVLLFIIIVGVLVLAIGVDVAAAIAWCAINSKQGDEAMNHKDVVRIMRLPHAYHIDADLPLPAYEITNSAGLDLFAAVAPHPPMIIPPAGRASIPTGLAFALPPNIEGQIRSRSGLVLHFGVVVLNDTIDAAYRGEVHVILVNLGREPFAVKRGARIGLLVLAPTVQANILEVSSLEVP
jgi:dUTP pyrophosphatase